MAPLFKLIFLAEKLLPNQQLRLDLLQLLSHMNPTPDLSQTAPAITIFIQALQDNITVDRIDTLWALSYISDGDNSNIQAVLDAGDIDTVVDLIDKDESVVVVRPVLRTTEHFIIVNDKQTQATPGRIY